MSMRFTQLQCKEVICVSDGRRLGFVTDVQVEIPSGNRAGGGEARRLQGAERKAGSAT